MKTKQFILFFMVLMSYMSESALAYDHGWTDANGTLWTFNISGSNATLFNIYYEDDGDYKPCIGGTIPQNLIIPSQVYVSGTPYTVTAIGDGAFYECWNVKTITIPDGVTSIGYDAFWLSGITSIVIPEGVTNIKTYTFYGCEDLTSVTIPGSVTWIDQGAFEDCDNITSVTVNALIPPSTFENPYISYAQLFSSCYSKATLYVPYSCKAAYEAAKEWKAFKEIVEMDQASSFITFVDSNVKNLCLANWDTNGDGKLSMAEAASVTSIGTVFRNNTSITSFDELRYFTGLTTIGGYAFQNCSSLTSISIPESVTSIDSWAFSGCSGLTKAEFASIERLCNISFEADNSNPLYYAHHLYIDGQEVKDVVIPNSVTSIGQYVFEGCSGPTSITIPNSVTNIGYCAFERSSGLTSITIPISVVTIGEWAFCHCSGLTTAIIPNSVTTIGNAAFYDCPSLTSVTIGNRVTSIGSSAFNGCSSLTSITIPESVTNIGVSAFWCSGLTRVNNQSETPQSIDNNYTFSNRANATLYVPYGCKTAYEAADYWKEFKEIIETNTVNVGSTGFATYCSPNALDFSGVTDIKAYVASDFNSATNTLTLTRVTEVPAEEGLYIVGTAGSYEIPETTTDAVYSNRLKGVTTATTISPTEGSNTNFILSNGSHGVGFYTLSAAGELAGGKAYLQLPTASFANIKALNIVLDDDDDATGITEIQDIQDAHGVIYNLAGQRVNKAQKGLYIINGKKTLIK